MSLQRSPRARRARRAALRLEGLETREVLNGAMKFDFGTAASPVAAGYTAVTEATAYTAARGHGWLSGQINAIDRQVGDDLTRDINWGRGAGVFAADVANGDYTVTVTLGDTAARDEVALDLEGVRRDLLNTAAGQVLTKSYDVTVRDGQLTFRIADLGGNDESWTIRGLEVAARGTAAPAAVQVIDDGDAGFATSGAWDRYVGLGHAGDFSYTQTGGAADVATWTFAVTPGQYRVSATWVARPNRAADAPYTVLDGATSLGTFRADQRLDPNDFADAGSAWENLGTVSIAGNSLVVRLSDAASGEYVIADGVRIERITTAPPPAAVQVIDDGDAGYSTGGSWDRYVGLGHAGDFSYTPSGSGADVASWAFNVTPGQYRVSATWVARPNRASDAPYTVLDGATALGTFRADQRLDPNDFADAGSVWENLGTVSIAGNSLVVRLSDAASGEYVIADGVRIERIDAAAPAAPSGLRARTLSTSEVLLRWSGGPTAFKVERSLSGTDGWSVIATTAAGATSYTDAGLQAGRTYFYRVRATAAGGDSAPTATAQALTFERVVYVSNSSEMQQALRAATPGTAVLMRGGVYTGENHFSNIQGTAGRPIVLAAADPADRPIIRGGGEGLKFTDAAYLELWDITLERQTGNGINIDDGATYATPSHHVTLRGLTIRDVDPSGNFDGLKLTGVDQFRVEECTFAGWGGSGIDMVGCHDGVIERSRFTGGTGAHGIGAKGGSRNLVIRDNRFENAGDRAIQLGGVHPLAGFRPVGVPYECKDALVEGNVIVGSNAAVTFVGVDGSTVRYNTIYRPRGHVIRILQENREPSMVPSRNGVFTDNLVAWNNGEMGEAVNVGTGTAPQTFAFARNWWYCQNAPELSRPSLPTAETGGTYGTDPQFVDAANGDFRLKPGSPASAVGAYAPRP